MGYKKHIPKHLRKIYSNRIRSRFWVILRAKWRFGKMYRQAEKLHRMGRVENNLHLDPDHIYWDFNCYEKTFEECLFGDKGFQNRHKFDPKTASKRQKKRQAKRWFRRNPVWNRNQLIGMELGGGMKLKKVIVNIPDDAPPTKWRNKDLHGEQAVIMESRSGMEVFRYSRTKGVRNPLMRIFFKYKNVMRGADKDQWTYKTRYFN